MGRSITHLVGRLPLGIITNRRKIHTHELKKCLGCGFVSGSCRRPAKSMPQRLQMFPGGVFASSLELIGSFKSSALSSKQAGPYRGWETGARYLQERPKVCFGCRILQAARKPNSVLSDHSSRRVITDVLQQPTRRFRHMFAHALRLGATGRHAFAA